MVKTTDHTNELAEVFGFNLCGLRFVADSMLYGTQIRGYVMRPLFGMAETMYGPITLNPEDLV